VTADNGNKIGRGFCANCDSPITSTPATMPMIGVKVGSLDDPAKFRPTLDLYMSSAPPWAPIRADLPMFDKMPS
jgi:hypothetical protein